MEYQSVVSVESAACPGVRYRVRRMSLAGRLELVREVRSAGATLPFHQAGESVEDRLRAAEIGAAIDAVYIRWGLDCIDGLAIDGQAADAALLIGRGPEPLCREIAAAVRRECFLGEEERKN